MERLLSRWLSPYHLYFLILVLIGFLLWLFLIKIRDPQPYLIIISAFVLVIGFLFTAVVTLHSKMIDQAFKMILTFRNDKDYHDATHYLGYFFKANKNLTVDDIIEIFTDDRYMKVRVSLYKVANFYEQMAIAVKYREINEPITEEFFIGIFIRFYETTKDFFPVIRNQVDVDPRPFGAVTRSEVYCEIDNLYKKWKPRYEKLIDHLVRGSSPKSWLVSLLRWGGIALAVISVVALIYVQGAATALAPTTPLAKVFVLLFIVGISGAIVGFLPVWRKT